MAVSTGEEDDRKFFVVGNGANSYQDENGATKTVTNYVKLTEEVGEELVKKSVTEVTATDGDDFGENLCLGTLTHAANSVKITFTMWFEGSLTSGEVSTGIDSTDKFNANLYFYAVRIVA